MNFVLKYLTPKNKTYNKKSINKDEIKEVN